VTNNRTRGHSSGHGGGGIGSDSVYAVQIINSTVSGNFSFVEGGGVLNKGSILIITNSTFVGNSAGGYLAQNLAMASSERVRSLMLFGSTPGLKNSQAHTWLPRVAQEGLRKFLAATIDDRFPHGHDRGHIEWFLDEAGKNDTAFIGRFVGLMTTLWWADELPRIKCPTLLVMPGAETVGGTENYAVMRAKIPDCELITYEGLPHNICDIVPDRCAADILAFLRRRFP